MVLLSHNVEEGWLMVINHHYIHFQEVVAVELDVVGKVCSYHGCQYQEKLERVSFTEQCHKNNFALLSCKMDTAFIIALVSKNTNLSRVWCLTSQNTSS